MRLWILDFHTPRMRNDPKFMDRYHLKDKKILVFGLGEIHTWLQLPSNSKMEKIREKRN